MHQNDTVTAVSIPARSLRRLHTRDPDDIARNLSGWDQVYDQITCGTFAGTLDELRLSGVQVFRERINQSVHQVCCVRPDAVWFGLPLEADASRINGRRVDTQGLMARPGGREFELVTPPCHDIYGIVVERSVLAEGERRHGAVAALGGIDRAEILRVDPAARAACLRALAAVMDVNDAAGAAEAQDRIVEALLLTLDAASVEACALQSQQRRRKVVAQARAYLFEHRARAVSIPELCEHAHVSRRTLQYCFEDVLGVSPVVYLRRLRLNGIRRTLLDNADGTRGIGSVAADWGMDNFSQFSSDYKRLFGASPSAYVKMSREAGTA